MTNNNGTNDTLIGTTFAADMTQNLGTGGSPSFTGLTVQGGPLDILGTVNQTGSFFISDPGAPGPFPRFQIAVRSTATNPGLVIVPSGGPYVPFMVNATGVMSDQNLGNPSSLAAYERLDTWNTTLLGAGTGTVANFSGHLLRVGGVVSLDIDNQGFLVGNVATNLTGNGAAAIPTQFRPRTDSGFTSVFVQLPIESNFAGTPGYSLAQL